MGCYKEEDIVGLRLESEIVCMECRTDEDWDQMTEEEVITQEETEGDVIYFCDQCKKRI